MKIFVIIVTYNGKQWYDRCFGSLRASSIPVQTIVVDNSPSGEDAEYIKSHFPEVHLIKPEENIGFGRANNLGMRYAFDQGCDFVFLLNQDTRIKPDCLSIMLPIIEQHPKCGIYSPMHISGDEKSLYIEIEDGTTDHANSLLSDCYFNSLQDIYFFKYVNAAAWLIPRSTIEIIGGFDPMFFVYGEDDNYLQRLQYHGLKVGLIPKAQIIHDHKDGTNAKSPEYLSYRYWQTRLSDYLNINKKLKTNSIIVYYLRKAIGSLLLFDTRNMKKYLSELKFVWERKEGIDKSRNANMQKGLTWL